MKAFEDKKYWKKIKKKHISENSIPEYLENY
jgi:hypothetical protein